MASPSVHLLPNYDEYLIAYKDRGFIPRLGTGADRFPHHLIIDGRLAGSWRATPKRRSIPIDAAPYKQPTRAAAHAIKAAGDRFERFIGLPTVD